MADTQGMAAVEAALRRKEEECQALQVTDGSCGYPEVEVSMLIPVT